MSFITEMLFSLHNVVENCYFGENLSSAHFSQKEMYTVYSFKVCILHLYTTVV